MTGPTINIVIDPATGDVTIMAVARSEGEEKTLAPFVELATRWIPKIRAELQAATPFDKNR